MASNKTVPDRSRISSPLQSICFTGEFHENATHVTVYQDAEIVRFTVVGSIGGKQIRAILTGKPDDYELSINQ